MSTTERPDKTYAALTAAERDVLAEVAHLQTTGPPEAVEITDNLDEDGHPRRRSIHRNLSNLAEDGYLHRHESGDSRRTVKYEVTEKGWDMLRSLKSRYERIPFPE